MAATLDSHRSFPVPEDRRTTGHADLSGDDVLAPIMAGAYARGIADTFELLGLPALCLDRQGRVLVVAKAAEPTLAAGLEVRSGHLLAGCGDDNIALGDFLASTLQAPEARPRVTLTTSGLTLRALPVPRPSPDQLMHAIVLVDVPVRPAE